MENVLEREIGSRLDSVPFGKFHLSITIILALVGFLEAYESAVTGGLVVSAGPALHLTQLQLRWLVIAPTISIVISVFVGSLISDRISRKTILLVGVTWTCFFVLVTSFVNSGMALIVVRVISGFGFGLALPAAYPIGTELLPARHRSTFGWIYEIFLGTGFTLTSVIGLIFANVQQGWRFLPVPGAIMFFFLPLLIYYRIPESPRWLLSRGKSKEAIKVLNTILEKAGCAGASLSEPTKAVAGGVPEKREEVPGFASLFARGHAQRTIIAILVYTCGAVPFYIFSTLFPAIMVAHGFVLVKSFAFAIVLFVVTIPGKFINGILMERLGRVITIAIALLSGVVATGLIMLSSNSVVLIIAEVILGLTVLSSWPSIRVYMTEQFPTALRGRGYFLGECVGRFIGGIPIPFILAGYVKQPNVIYSVVLVFIIIGGLTPLLAGVDTRGQLELVTPANEKSI
ncbi:MFS transporter [Desulfosporosinus sp. PR]|uniref:MFS transporter n=1 Tax=Candidatus Desulfosporosinus nitrosoreducens TaxID=3401928 RepID=UPI0027EC5582|nr:MFS transporter [Desulfosporosinus sp. PR]MDQ7093558.1 MFS transporter [Desulfosporosinus sp. PR]